MCRGGRKDTLCFRIFVWEAAFCCAGWEITVQLTPLVTVQGLNLCGNKTLTCSGHKIPLYKLVHINSYICVSLLCLLALCNVCLSCNCYNLNLIRHKFPSVVSAKVTLFCNMTPSTMINWYRSTKLHSVQSVCMSIYLFIYLSYLSIHPSIHLAS